MLPFVLDGEEESNCYCGDTVLWRIKFILILLKLMFTYILICGFRIIHLNHFQMNKMCYNLLRIAALENSEAY